MGEAWVGAGYRVASDGKTLLSADGLRQYRPPSYKPSLDTFQANFESRPPNLTQWQSNAHLDILD
jgi:filamentous hemagglutinin